MTGLLHIFTNDTTGMMFAIVSMLFIIFGFMLLYATFKIIRHIADGYSQERAAKNAFRGLRSEAHLSGEVLAAISATIHQMNENQHDIESTILTIQQVKRNYSPWNAKSQMLLKMPR